MAVTHFIPEIWSSYILERYMAKNVFASLVDRKYEGEARKGNTIHIPGVVAPAVKDYKAASRTTSADAISDTGIDILIDQEKNFDFYVDDIDNAQSNENLLPLYTDAAGDSLATDADQFIANLLVANATGMPWSSNPTTGDAAFNVVKDARKLMNKANVPDDDLRVAVVNAEFEALLVGADSKLTSFDSSGDTAGLRNATVGKLLGFRVVTSNNLPESDSPQAVFFHQRAAAFVSQIDEVEGMRAQDKFADRIRGLHVYGGKVVKAPGVLVFNRAGS
ncbi:phage capsid protein [Mycobacteroides abscessus]|uniref:phage capsid protein n=1 Tax=Mycobacteroides abscessus TaxID=36809 RepID=UPI00092B4588|nr:phage capsid protein [Mycobacteroides abscessus]MDM2174671.1 P22 phage major capsid protein family protein [Mycobacteroides abscessus]MDM2179582.1 P22 phage major capsid protein family protein [Mycobacteroides abscessus]MDM2209608.1 P22 phage major capsid protein family protein [Mycobacteroides abscessus]MDM2214621.1 P22 phage major capsid protein family protein [Mycobacteroides abscessus]MDM2219615.1 P22 phage major capsid protein family protein [Mycobacteroides abscessus]